MNCILIDQPAINADHVIKLNPRESKHIIDVLKKNVGDTVLAGIVNGPIGMTPITSIHNGTVYIKAPEGPTPPRPPVDIILAMPRPKVMKRLWSTIASIGVQRIVIIGAERVEPYYFESHAIDATTYMPRVREGLEQARDTHVPEVHIIKSFSWFSAHFLASVPPDHCKLLAEPRAVTPVRTVINKHGNAKRVTLAIGPEGGWTADEINTFQRHGFELAGMPGRTLRTDTAVVALLALVYDAL